MRVEIALCVIWGKGHEAHRLNYANVYEGRPHVLMNKPYSKRVNILDLKSKSIFQLIIERLQCLFLFFMLFVPAIVLADVEQGTYTVSEMGSEVYWKAFLPSKTLYGRVTTKPVAVELKTKQSTAIKNKPSMFSPITIKGTLEFDLASVAVLSEEDPVESVSWTNTLKSDEYLAVSIFPSLSFEIQSITQKEDPSFQETNNSIIEGSLVTFGQKVPISVPAILGIGGGYIMVTADFELPRDCFTYNKNISGNADKDVGKKPIGQKLSGQKILIRLKLRALKNTHETNNEN